MRVRLDYTYPEVFVKLRRTGGEFLFSFPRKQKFREKIRIISKLVEGKELIYVKCAVTSGTRKESHLACSHEARTSP